MRGVVSGLIWGGVVSIFGLGVVSQLAPLPGASNETAAPDAEAAVTEAAPEAVAAASEVVVPETVVPEVSPVPVPVPVTPDAVAVVPEAVPSEAVSVAEAPLPGEMPSHSPLAPEPEPEAEVVAAAPVPEPVAPAEPLLDQPDVAALQPDALVVPEPAVPEAVVPEVAPGAVTPEAVITPEAATPDPVVPEVVAPAIVAPLAPAAELPEAVAGVTTNRLPRISGDADAGDKAAGAETDPMAATAAPADTRPVARFAAPFDNAAKKPLYAILLLDDGKVQVDRAALATMPLPITIVIDPTAPDAAKLAETYRKAGKEVAMLATAIPKGAKASDLQVSFEAHAKALPEAVAVVDLPREGFQNNRQLAGDLVPLIKDQGRGLVTFDKGLNAGDQVARREGVPAALIFRELDAEGEAAPLIRRYLDRAAFKAVQDGRVVVLGQARPDTIAALLEWSVEGRAGSVALAPLTAVMSVPE